MKGSGRWVAAAYAAATLLFAGCSGSSVTPRTTGSMGTTAASPAQPMNCSVGISVPGFHVIDRNRVPQVDRVGLSVKMRDDAGHKLLLSAGISGDFAEGATPRGQFVLSSGIQGRLYGAGSVWVLTWNEQGPCGSHVVVGNDVSKHGFIMAMSDAGVLQSGD